MEELRHGPAKPKMPAMHHAEMPGCARQPREEQLFVGQARFVRNRTRGNLLAAEHAAQVVDQLVGAVEHVAARLSRRHRACDRRRSVRRPLGRRIECGGIGAEGDRRRT
ncbi:MAG: hypothetical protein ACLT98_12870, partial [Eggerthellaceae bacterium]